MNAAARQPKNTPRHSPAFSGELLPSGTRPPPAVSLPPACCNSRDIFVGIRGHRHRVRRQSMSPLAIPRPASDEAAPFYHGYIAEVRGENIAEQLASQLREVE